MSFAARAQPRYRCESCGHNPERWSARCPRCQGWIANASGADTSSAAPPHKKPTPPQASIREAEPVRRPRPASESPPVSASTSLDPENVEPLESDLVPLTEIKAVQRPRISTAIEPFDRVTGGGLVLGGSFLISGNPGAGKSTLLSQMLYHARRPDGASCERLMWATAEETVEHIAMRAERLGTAHSKIRVTREEDVDRILTHANRFRPEILVVDSIQTVSTADIDSVVGSVQQVKECALRLDRFGKGSGTCVVLICQVNKDGQSAGPSALKHLVDVLLSLDNSEEFPALRYLRSPGKNRFGSESEVGCFEMRSSGLCPVANPPSPEEAEAERDELLPVAQELVYQLLEAGGTIGPGLRDRIAGRLDLNPRGSR